MSHDLRDEFGRFRKYTCENCDATFEKDEAHNLYKAYEILERPTKCPHCGAEASIW